ncbi:MAG TPA: glycoside hydrolase family 3 C-terminal domain-containing protein [Gammaproteobacteria bacterium]|nr:glycoside hydrolase family 3 C-terminal domain-containing protein [Gammaproteobacteria bacterium]
MIQNQAECSKTSSSIGLALIRAVSLLAVITAPASQAKNEAYLDPGLPVEERVNDLVGRMTLEEKVSQMLDVAPAIDRLGVPEYNWWNEALHGVARSGLATSFPQAIGFAATWDEALVFRMATAISDEARAKHHYYERQGKRLRYQGLTMWSPNINIFRDPRWGRGQETYGEDPFLTGSLAVQFVRGLQGDDPRYFKTVATVKHFAVHSGPEPERHTFDAEIDERDLRETYLPAFRKGIQEGGSYSLMCAYNRVDGEPACGNKHLLQDILRAEWGFPGYIVSDCWALDDIYKNHKSAASPAGAAAMALKAGTDLDCGTQVYSFLVEAVKKGLVTEAEVDAAVKRLFTARFRLGMFDPDKRVKYARIPYSVVDSAEHRQLAREVTRESMVLLKNERVLPLKKDPGTLAVIGPNADQWQMLLGNYNGVPSDVVTPLRGIREAVAPGTKVIYTRGSQLADGFPMFETVPGEVLFMPDGSTPGLKAEYFDSGEMTGEALYAETVSRVDVNWRDGTPRAGMNDDDFGVRWTGILKPRKTGMYRLGTIATMKFEFYLDGQELFRSNYHFHNELGDPRVEAAAQPVKLEAGKTYKIRLDAQETYGEAMFQLVWSTPESDRDLLQEALETAGKADAAVMFLGLTPRLEGEEMQVEVAGFRGGDRTTIELPRPQRALLEKVTALMKQQGKPVVLVLLNGSALAVNWAQQNVPAILEAWYPGQAAGAAIADVLFGDYNPAGRLPVTFYKSVDDLPPFEDYAMKGRTYKYFGGEPLYPFGHGLSYTAFDYKKLRAPESIAAGDTVTVKVDVTNTGDRAGDEVVQLYVSYPQSAVERPRKKLVGFKRIALKPKQTETVAIELPADELRYWSDEKNQWVLEDKPVQLQVGASSADIRLTKGLDVGK